MLKMFMWFFRSLCCCQDLGQKQSIFVGISTCMWLEFVELWTSPNSKDWHFTFSWTSTSFLLSHLTFTYIHIQCLYTWYSTWTYSYCKLTLFFFRILKNKYHLQLIATTSHSTHNSIVPAIKIASIAAEQTFLMTSPLNKDTKIILKLDLGEKGESIVSVWSLVQHGECSWINSFWGRLMKVKMNGQ